MTNSRSELVFTSMIQVPLIYLTWPCIPFIKVHENVGTKHASIIVKLTYKKFRILKDAVYM